MQYKITVCYKMEDLLYIYAYTDIQLRIDCRCLVVGLAQWKFSGDKHKSLQVDTERTFHQRYPLAML